MKKFFLIIFCVPLFISADGLAEKQQKPEWYKNFKAIRKQWFFFNVTRMSALFKSLPPDVQEKLLYTMKNNKIHIYSHNVKRNWWDFYSRMNLYSAINKVLQKIEEKKIYRDDKHKRKVLLKMWLDIKNKIESDSLYYVYKALKKIS